MNLPYKLADLLAPPCPPPAGGFLNSLPEAFGALNADGEVWVIGYKGEWFHKQRPSLRVRLANWLIAVGSMRARRRALADHQ